MDSHKSVAHRIAFRHVGSDTHHPESAQVTRMTRFHEGISASRGIRNSHHYAVAQRASSVSDRPSLDSDEMTKDRQKHPLAKGAYSHREILQCVPYAGRVSGIELMGDAHTWWHKAAGRYARGHSPEIGSVLNFRSIKRMHLGHVAVVTGIVNRREILVTQAHWDHSGSTPRGISKGIEVVDVSSANDWTAVRVARGHSSTYGAVYPTYGFIYRDPAPSTRIAATGSNSPPIQSIAPLANQQSKPWAARGRGGPTQYATAPPLSGPAIASSAPDRALQ